MDSFVCSRKNTTSFTPVAPHRWTQSATPRGGTQSRYSLEVASGSDSFDVRVRSDVAGEDLEQVLTECELVETYRRVDQHLTGTPELVVTVALTAVTVVRLVDALLRRWRRDVVLDLRDRTIQQQEALTTRNGRLIVINDRGEVVVHEATSLSVASDVVTKALQKKL